MLIISGKSRSAGRARQPDRSGRRDETPALAWSAVAKRCPQRGQYRSAHAPRQSAAVGDMDPQTQQMVVGALGVGARFGVLLPFSREHESEADYLGLIFGARACLDPREAPRLWQPRAAVEPRRSSCPRIRAMTRVSASSGSGCRKR